MPDSNPFRDAPELSDEDAERMAATTAEERRQDFPPAKEANSATREPATTARPKRAMKRQPESQPTAQDELAEREAYFARMKPVETSGVKAVQPMNFLSLEEAAKLGTTDYAIKRLLPARGVVILYGEPAAGKSFTMKSVAGHLAEGWDFDGRRVHRKPIYWLALEGSGGLGKRVQALQIGAQKAGKPAMQGVFRFWTGSFDLKDGDQCDELIKTITDAGHQGAVVVIDTLSQATIGLDENSNQMAEAIGNATRIAETIGGLVVLIHHVGKDSARGPRGHSSLVGNADATIFVSKAQGWKGAVWTVTKSKDDAEGQTVAFRLNVVDLGKDEDNDTVTSCYAEPFQPTDEELQAQKDAEKKPKKPKLADSIQFALKVFNDSIREHGKAGWLELDKFREAFLDQYVPPESGDPKKDAQNARAAYSRAVSGLQAKGFVRKVKDKLQNIQPD